MRERLKRRNQAGLLVAPFIMFAVVLLWTSLFWQGYASLTQTHGEVAVSQEQERVVARFIAAADSADCVNHGKSASTVCRAAQPVSEAASATSLNIHLDWTTELASDSSIAVPPKGEDWALYVRDYYKTLNAQDGRSVLSVRDVFSQTQPLSRVHVLQRSAQTLLTGLVYISGEIADEYATSALQERITLEVRALGSSNALDWEVRHFFADVSVTDAVNSNSSATIYLTVAFKEPLEVRLNATSPVCVLYVGDPDDVCRQALGLWK